jgi:hypothetical protein
MSQSGPEQTPLRPPPQRQFPQPAVLEIYYQAFPAVPRISLYTMQLAVLRLASICIIFYLSLAGALPTPGSLLGRAYTYRSADSSAYLPVAPRLGRAARFQARASRDTHTPRAEAEREARDARAILLSHQQAVPFVPSLSPPAAPSASSTPAVPIYVPVPAPSSAPLRHTSAEHGKSTKHKAKTVKPTKKVHHVSVE